MIRQWILLANASHARLFSRDSPSGRPVPLATLEHPESRLKGAALADDRPGHEASDNSSGGNRYEPRIDVGRKEHQQFAREIAQRLNEQRLQDARLRKLSGADSEFNVER